MTTPSSSNPPRENLFLSLALNILIPALILSKLAGEDRLGPMGALLGALAFPIGYFIYDKIKRGKNNFFSIIGFASTLLTGGFGLLALDGLWFAVKEAGVPLIFGIAILASLQTKTPLVRMMFFNPTLFNTTKIEGLLAERNQTAAFDQLMTRAAYWLAGSFFLSAVLNFFLTRHVVKSAGGSSEQITELGKLMWLSWPVIVLPCMIVMIYALFRMINGLKDLTGLDMEELLAEEAKAKSPPKQA